MGIRNSSTLLALESSQSAIEDEKKRNKESDQGFGILWTVVPVPIQERIVASFLTCSCDPRSFLLDPSSLHRTLYTDLDLDFRIESEIQDPTTTRILSTS